MKPSNAEIVQVIQKRVLFKKRLQTVFIFSALILLSSFFVYPFVCYVSGGLFVFALLLIWKRTVSTSEIIAQLESCLGSKERITTVSELENDDVRKEFIAKQIEELLQAHPEKIADFVYPSLLFSIFFFMLALAGFAYHVHLQATPDTALLQNIEHQITNPELPKEVKKEFSELKDAIAVYGLGSNEVNDAISETQDALQKAQTNSLTPTPTPTPTATPTSPADKPQESPSPTVQADKSSKDGDKKESADGNGDKKEGGKEGGDSGKGEGKEKKDDSSGKGEGKDKKDSGENKDGKGSEKDSSSALNEAQKTLDQAKQEQQDSKKDDSSKGKKEDQGEGDKESQKSDKEQSSKDGSQKKENANPSKGEQGEKSPDKQNQPQGDGKESPGEKSSEKKDEDAKQKKPPQSPEGEGGKLSSDQQKPEGKQDEDGTTGSSKEKKIDEVSVPGIDEKLNTEQVGKEGRLTNKDEETAYKRKLQEMNNMKSDPALEGGNQYIPKEYERYIN